MSQNTTTEPSTNSISAQSLTQFCDEYLSASAFKDYAPNGLQVDGGRPIQRIVTGVTACEALIDAAITDNANAIMVHHGYFWKGEPAPITGLKGRRIRKLMQHGISMIGYHLPLDAHPSKVIDTQLTSDMRGTLRDFTRDIGVTAHYGSLFDHILGAACTNTDTFDHSLAIGSRFRIIIRVMFIIRRNM